MRRWRDVGLWSVLAASGLSCGARTALSLNEVAVDAAAPVPTCAPDASACLLRGEDPCGAATPVAKVCDPSTLQWSCPAGAWPYRGLADRSAPCLPFHDPSGPIRGLSGILSRLPTDDGRCLWIAEGMHLTSGQSLRNVALEGDTHAPLRTCPTRATFVGGAPSTSVVFADGSADPSLFVEISDGYRLGGTTHVPYRLFRIDPNAVFGLTELGTGLGYWDGARQRIVISGPAQLRFKTDLDFGNASVVDGRYAYLWGCNAPGHFLTQGCLLARIDPSNTLELFADPGRWIESVRGSDGSVVFDEGPWISSVLHDPEIGPNFLHLFAVGFGADLQLQRAPRPEGPWSAPRVIATCDLPRADPHSYCAAPIVHAELADPRRTDELVVSYGIGSTAPGTSTAPEDQWTRLAWISTR